MSDQQLRAQLHQYIDKADTVVLLDLQETIQARSEGRWEWWNDPEFTAYLDRTDEEIKAGTLVTYSMEESMTKARQVADNARQEGNAA